MRWTAAEISGPIPSPGKIVTVKGGPEAGEVEARREFCDGVSSEFALESAPRDKTRDCNIVKAQRDCQGRDLTGEGRQRSGCGLIGSEEELTRLAAGWEHRLQKHKTAMPTLVRP